MRPLEGIKIVEMASVVAAPITSRLLSDYGADVIKIESLKGDDLRSAGKSYNLPCDDDFNPLFTLANTNKENICIDAKNDVGREIIIKLIQSADVFITNICYDSLKRLRLDYDSIKSICPSIIYAYFSGYGMYGPERSKPGFDVTAFWLRNGAMLDWKDHNSFIMNPSYAFGDMATSSTFLSGILMAIVGRMSTGQGTFVTTSLQACEIGTICVISYPHSHHSTDKFYMISYIKPILSPLFINAKMINTLVFSAMITVQKKQNFHPYSA